MFIPTLLKQGKKIVILSNSFSDVPNLFRDLETVFEETPSNFYKTIVKLCFPVAKDFLNSLTPQKKKAMSYSPELAMLDFFSANLPSSENVFLYANDIHRFGIDNLTDALAFLIQKHSVDVAVTIDGGTDSLMRGDEAAVATIVEDFCSLVALDNVRLNASLNLKSAILLVGGFGADRFHGASDASSLRAVAELTRMGGFLGSSSVQQDSAGFKFFSDFMNFYQNEYPNSMKSIVGSMIISSVVGQYGPYQNDVTPKIVPRSPADTPGSAPLSAVQMLGFRSEASAAAAAPPPGGGDRKSVV